MIRSVHKEQKEEEEDNDKAANQRLVEEKAKMGEGKEATTGGEEC